MPTPSLLALSQNRLRHGDPKWSKTALSAGKRSDAVKAAFVLGERGAIRSLTRFDDMPDENDVIAGLEVMISQRSGERRVGKEWVSTCGYGWSTVHKKKKK